MCFENSSGFIYVSPQWFAMAYDEAEKESLHWEHVIDRCSTNVEGFNNLQKQMVTESAIGNEDLGLVAGGREQNYDIHVENCLTNVSNIQNCSIWTCVADRIDFRGIVCNSTGDYLIDTLKKKHTFLSLSMLNIPKHPRRDIEKLGLSQMSNEKDCFVQVAAPELSVAEHVNELMAAEKLILLKEWESKSLVQQLLGDVHDRPQSKHDVDQPCSTPSGDRMKQSGDRISGDRMKQSGDRMQQHFVEQLLKHGINKEIVEAGSDGANIEKMNDKVMEGAIEFCYRDGFDGAFNFLAVKVYTDIANEFGAWLDSHDQPPKLIELVYCICEKGSIVRAEPIKIPRAFGYFGCEDTCCFDVIDGDFHKYMFAAERRDCVLNGVKDEIRQYIKRDDDLNGRHMMSRFLQSLSSNQTNNHQYEQKVAKHKNRLLKKLKQEPKYQKGLEENNQEWVKDGINNNETRLKNHIKKEAEMIRTDNQYILDLFDKIPVQEFCVKAMEHFANLYKVDKLNELKEQHSEHNY